jgi:hypothetical protein
LTSRTHFAADSADEDSFTLLEKPSSNAAHRHSLLAATIALTLDGGGSTPSAAHGRKLFDFRFLELDVLASDRIVLAEAHFLGLVPRVLLRHVVEAGSSGGQQFDFLSYRLGHCRVLE